MISVINRCRPFTSPPAEAACLLRSLLDLFRVPVVVVRPDRRLVHANASGERFLREGHVLHVQDGFLHVVGNACALVALEDAIRSATPRAVERPNQTNIALMGIDGRPVLARVIPVQSSAVPDETGEALAAIFFPALEDTVDDIASHIQSGLGFTTCEARVAAHIATGLGPGAIAARLNLSVNTIRSHLARIYSKTGCADQTAVCSMINRIALPVYAVK